MTTRGIHRVLATVVAASVAAGGFAVAASVGPTQSAWTAHAAATTTISAGTWLPSLGTCTGTTQRGTATSCRIDRIEVNGWGTPGSQTRNYYVYFDAPSAKTIEFSVDLSRATGSGTGAGWDWDTATVAAGAQFTPAPDWSCSLLPRVSGRAHNWYTTVYLQVHENGTAQPGTCR